MLLGQPVQAGKGQPTDTDSPPKIGWQSNSVRRALAILELLNESQRHASLSEISRKLTLPKSTTSLLLSTLETTGYVARDSEERRYSLSVKAHVLGFGLLNHLTLSRRATPVLKSIAASLGVTAHVAVLDGDQALFVNKVDGRQRPCCDIYPGRRTNLQCTAVGKVLLAYVNEEHRREFLMRRHPIRHTSRTIASAEELVKEIGRVRKLGYARDNQEEELLVHCLAVPIFSRDGDPVAALGITGTAAEIRSDHLETLTAYLEKMSNQILRAGFRSK